MCPRFCPAKLACNFSTIGGVITLYTPAPTWKRIAAHILYVCARSLGETQTFVRHCAAAGVLMPPKKDGRRDALVRARAAKLAAAAQADVVRAAPESDEEWVPDAPWSHGDAGSDADAGSHAREERVRRRRRVRPRRCWRGWHARLCARRRRLRARQRDPTRRDPTRRCFLHCSCLVSKRHALCCFRLRVCFLSQTTCVPEARCSLIQHRSNYNL